MSVRLGEILVKERLITARQLQKALSFKRAMDASWELLDQDGLHNDDDITGVSPAVRVPSLNLKYYEIDPTVIK